MRYEALVHVVIEVDNTDDLKAASLAAHRAAHAEVDAYWAEQLTATAEMGLQSVLGGPPMFESLTAVVHQYDGLRLVGFHVSASEVTEVPGSERHRRLPDEG